MKRIGDVLCRSSLLLLLVVSMGSAAAKGERIVIYGATGAIGGVIAQEALSRGDTVIGVARDPTKLKITIPTTRPSPAMSPIWTASSALRRARMPSSSRC